MIRETSSTGNAEFDTGTSRAATPSAGSRATVPVGQAPPAAGPDAVTDAVTDVETDVETPVAHSAGRAPAPAPDLNPRSLARLREVRVVAQELLTVLGEIRAGSVTAKGTAPFLQQTKSDLARLLGELASAAPDPEQADSLQQLRLQFARMRINRLLVEPEVDAPPEAFVRDLATLEGLCRQMIYRTGVLTIPARLNDWLSKARPGYYVPFHAVFEDELPSLEDRSRVLKYLAWAPEAIRGGLVDVNTGLIYHYSRSAWAQASSVLLVLLALVASVGLLVAAVYASGLLPAQVALAPDDLPVLLGVWLAALAGVLCHIVVTTAKRLRAQEELPPVVAPGDLPRVINAKQGQILVKLFVTLIAVFALVLTVGLAQAAGWQAFLAGYSLDSFVDLFSQSVEQRAAAQVSRLRQQLGLTEDTAAGGR